MPNLRYFLALAAATLGTGSASSQLTLSANFDHGSLRSWTGNTTTISLTPRDNYYGNGTWRWLYFQASGVLNTRPAFQMPNTFVGGSANLTGHRMMFSYDNENWQFFDNTSNTGSTYRFGNNTNFTSNNVWIAYAQPYSYGRSVSHTAEVLASPWAAPTSAANASGVIGFSAGGTDDMGRTVTPKALYGYRITNPATDSPTTPKKRVMLSSGLHAAEVLGSHAYEGLVDWLISADPRAARLREVAEFFCYPVLNPDGRFAGMARGTVQNSGNGVDPNGWFHPTRWSGTRTWTELRESGEAMIADIQATPGTGLDAFIDFHSTVPASPGDDFGFIEVDQGDNLAPWWVELRRLQPNVFEVDSTGTGWTTANFADIVLGARVDITFETMHGKNRPVSYYNDLGKNFGLAFFDAWASIDGDFNLDGVVNAADYTTWRDGAAAPADYALWTTNYGRTEPATATSVPEAASAALGLLAITWLPRRSRA
jgi:hypothetical protein